MEREDLIKILGKKLTYRDINKDTPVTDVIKALLEPDEYYELRYVGPGKVTRYVGGKKEGYIRIGVTLVDYKFGLP
ncbi:MAG: hypothetical protein KKF46_05995 [Nanoarchaeota archaeon]|nr:hypothetical protein [Nanoarchaeota archaeon]MBU1321885.1 hypothetical protein [Nanoarchaeota archaeon]MBU1597660.1 hypothetical protein [Nanoarchaeota archaeon]MBU2442223.1 hypothetical protein [Nanoarchaeota archaeon]